MRRHRPDVRFGSPGALIAALPAVLGFVPEKSLVLVSLEEGLMGAVMRADLSADLACNTGHLAGIAASSGADTVIAVIVDADGALCPMCNDDYRHLHAALEQSLGEHGIGLRACHVVDRVEVGGVWHCIDDCGDKGAVEDPSASPLAAAAVLDGRRLYARRSDLQAVIATVDPRRSRALLALIDGEAARREKSWRADPDGCGRRDVTRILSVAADVFGGGEPVDADITALACALTDVAVRDTMYALAIGTGAAHAENLWSVLARILPEPYRAEVLVLLAFSAYARGDGPLAGISLEAALRIDPDHRMAGMLDTALQSGIRPEQIRELAATGFRVAARLGVQLPPRRVFRAPTQSV